MNNECFGRFFLEFGSLSEPVVHKLRGTTSLNMVTSNPTFSGSLNKCFLHVMRLKMIKFFLMMKTMSMEWPKTTKIQQKNVAKASVNCDSRFSILLSILCRLISSKLG